MAWSGFPRRTSVATGRWRRKQPESRNTETWEKIKAFMLLFFLFVCGCRFDSSFGHLLSYGIRWQSADKRKSDKIPKYGGNSEGNHAISTHLIASEFRLLPTIETGAPLTTHDGIAVENVSPAFDWLINWKKTRIFDSKAFAPKRSSWSVHNGRIEIKQKWLHRNRKNVLVILAYRAPWQIDLLFFSHLMDDM